MNNSIAKDDLSKYQQLILNKIIAGFRPEKDFNIYELIRESVTQQALLANLNILVVETYSRIRAFLITNDFVIENKERVSYSLTEKGTSLKKYGSIERYTERAGKKSTWSMLHNLFNFA